MATSKPTITNIQDTFTSLVTNTNTVSLDLGATGRLNTNQDSDVVAAINELEVAIRGTSNNLVSADLTTAGLTATDLAAAVAEHETDIGTVQNLTTTASNLTDALNELDALQGNTSLSTTATTITAAINEHDAELGTITAGAMGTTASTVGGAIAELEAEIDTLNTFVEPTQSLTTTATTLADAVNELDSDIGARPHTGLTTTAKTLTAAINEHDTEIGSASLNTSATTLRGAINELHTEIGDAIQSGDNTTTANIGASLNSLDSAVGNLDNLNATIADHSTLVAAINSNKAQIDLLDSDGVVINQTLGSLNLLDSAGFVGSERDNFVAALNALRADIPLIYDENGTQLN